MGCGYFLNGRLESRVEWSSERTEIVRHLEASEGARCHAHVVQLRQQQAVELRQMVATQKARVLRGEMRVDARQLRRERRGRDALVLRRAASGDRRLTEQSAELREEFARELRGARVPVRERWKREAPLEPLADLIRIIAHQSVVRCISSFTLWNLLQL